MFGSKKIEEHATSIQEVFAGLSNNVEQLGKHQMGLQKILLLNLIVTGVTCAVAVLTISRMKGD